MKNTPQPWTLLSLIEGSKVTGHPKVPHVAGSVVALVQISLRSPPKIDINFQKKNTGSKYPKINWLDYEKNFTGCRTSNSKWKWFVGWIIQRVGEIFKTGDEDVPEAHGYSVWSLVQSPMIQLCRGVVQVHRVHELAVCSGLALIKQEDRQMLQNSVLHSGHVCVLHPVLGRGPHESLQRHISGQ